MIRAIHAVVSIFAVGSCLCTSAPAQQAASTDPTGNERMRTPSEPIWFPGTEDKDCPTGFLLITLLGSRASVTYPSIPLVAKDAAVPTDLDSELFKGSLMRSGPVPGLSGKTIEFISPTCTIEITIRHR
jgi:hypothetical protein